ncbi:MAG: hypothetical protein GW808_13400 [Sphingomonadales bacterium]|nr:hypothetical protein [Sphingomonadales bacterium]PIX64802.1 MAG: hypothetical protein COZ43_10930 [Sphingomonadales bacterium CG_4_10_14_3_um_filter_58_15]NCO48251.1 hypothetical protein [Sphingomonadales bacterium]NCO99720.1 hypothetical protein [Sphingomonadales bacterium]NCP27403.1 hypothetical protein [Sphingomonadales bacterium]
METEDRNDKEYAGLLQRDAAGFVLQCDDGSRYRLELLRTPIDEVEKRVVVTGRIASGAVLEADGVRLA